MGEPAWWTSVERYRVIDAMHEAGHAVAAKLLGAVGVRLRLDAENFEVRGTVDFDLNPSCEEPPGGWVIDLGGSPAQEMTPLERESDLPTRLWVVTRAGGIGGLVGCRALGLEVEVDEVMADCEHDDKSLELIVGSASAVAARRWVELRYRETWALLLRHADAVLAIARDALDGDDHGVEVELTRAANSSTALVFSEDELTGAHEVASVMGFSSWPNWRDYERRRFEEFKALHSS